LSNAAPPLMNSQSVRDIRSRVLAHAALEICYNGYNGIAMGATGAQLTNNARFAKAAYLGI